MKKNNVYVCSNCKKNVYIHVHKMLLNAMQLADMLKFIRDGMGDPHQYKFIFSITDNENGDYIDMSLNKELFNVYINHLASINEDNYTNYKGYYMDGKELMATMKMDGQDRSFKVSEMLGFLSFINEKADKDDEVIELTFE